MWGVGTNQCKTCPDLAPAPHRAQVKQVVEELGKQISTPLTLVSYLRVKVGEGVDKDESDFAAEVAATLKQTA